MSIHQKKLHANTFDTAWKSTAITLLARWYKPYVFDLIVQSAKVEQFPMSSEHWQSPQDLGGQSVHDGDILKTVKKVDMPPYTTLPCTG